MADLSERESGVNADKECGCRMMTSGGEEELAKRSADIGPEWSGWNGVENRWEREIDR